MLLASLHYTELSIHEIAFSWPHINLNNSSFQRLECLYTCLSTVKSAFDNFFALPLSAYYGCSFTFFAQLARYIVVLYKLSTLDDPAWDTGLVRSTIDLLFVLDEIINNLKEVREICGESPDDGIIARSVRIFSSVRSLCGAKLAADTDGSNHPSFQNATSENGIFLDSMSIEGLGDIWMRDIFA